MAGLSATELDPESLEAGEQIEYYCRAFVCGDPRGYRRAVITRVDSDEDVEFPVAVNIRDVISTDMMMKRVEDRFGNPLQSGEAMRRKLRTFHFVPGSFAVKSRPGALKEVLEGVVRAAFAAVHEGVHHVIDEIVPETPQSTESSSDEDDTDLEDCRPTSTPNIPQQTNRAVQKGIPCRRGPETTRKATPLRRCAR